MLNFVLLFFIPHKHYKFTKPQKDQTRFRIRNLSQFDSKFNIIIITNCMKDSKMTSLLSNWKPCMSNDPMAEYVTIKRVNSYSTKGRLFLIKSDKSLEPHIYAKFTLVINTACRVSCHIILSVPSVFKVKVA